MTTLEEMVETFCRAEWNADNSGEDWDQFAVRQRASPPSLCLTLCKTC